MRDMLQASPKPTVRFAEKCTISKYTTSEILVSNFMITGTLPFHEVSTFYVENN